jgi:hypothetical protein
MKTDARTLKQGTRGKPQLLEPPGADPHAGWCGRGEAERPPPIPIAPSMGALLRVKVPSRVGHNERSEAQLHEGDRVWGGSVERNCGPMDKNRIEGGADQGERARNREALVTKGRRRKSGGRAVKECVLTWGDLALCLKG